MRSIKRPGAPADIPLVPPIAARMLAAAICVATLSGCGSAAVTASGVVPASVVQRAESSVITVRCVNTNISANQMSEATGTGFVTLEGVVTAAHVVSSCAYAGPGSVSAGPFVVSVSRDDPAHDLALIAASNAGVPLALHGALPTAAEPVELLGLAGSSTGVVTPIAGTVLGTHATVTLYAENGSHETLTDAIVVTANGVIPGDSGGPAIDSAGRVIGVVEGAGGGRVYLTPAAQIASLTN